MSWDSIDSIDVTDRARAGGWVLPEYWTVMAEISEDTEATPTELDCYTPAQISAWTRDEWQYVTVNVYVEDDDGRQWGSDIIGGVEHGSFVMTDEQDRITGTAEIDALRAPGGDYSVIREHDMINSALCAAVKAVESFGNVVLTEPADTVSGL